MANANIKKKTFLHAPSYRIDRKSKTLERTSAAPYGSRTRARGNTELGMCYREVYKDYSSAI
jgi:hypothetical protein